MNLIFRAVAVLAVIGPELFAAGLEQSSASEAQFLSNTRQLTYEGRRSGEGYFSSDGKQLIFQSEREAGNPFYQIYIFDLESGDTHRVSPGFGLNDNSHGFLLRWGLSYEINGFGEMVGHLFGRGR